MMKSLLECDVACFVEEKTELRFVQRSKQDRLEVFDANILRRSRALSLHL